MTTTPKNTMPMTTPTMTTTASQEAGEGAATAAASPKNGGKKRETPYSPGREWRCGRDRNPFTFAILGDSEGRPGHKRCLVRQDPYPINRTGDEARYAPRESTYSREHLKQHAYLLTPEQVAEAAALRAEMEAVRERYLMELRERGEWHREGRKTTQEEWKVLSDMTDEWFALERRYLDALAKKTP